MKKTLKILLAILLVSTLVLTLTACKPTACEHEWQLKSETAATCEAPGGRLYECTKCGITRHEGIAQLDHKPVALDGTPATCKEAGLDGGTKCSVCGRLLTAQEATPLVPHDFEITETAPTCTTDGSIVRKCKVCGETITEIIPAAHTWDDGVITVEATCTTTGERLFTCTVCGETTTDIIAMTEHKYLWIDATEEAIGHYHCNICGKNFDANKNEITDLTPGATPGPGGVDPIPEGAIVPSYDGLVDNGSATGENNMSMDIWTVWHDDWDYITDFSSKIEGETLTVSYKGAAPWWGVQVFYKHSELEVGKEYTLNFKINVSKECDIQINGVVTHLNKGDNTISVTFTQTNKGVGDGDGLSSFDLQMGVWTPDEWSGFVGGDELITLVISQVYWLGDNAGSGGETPGPGGETDVREIAITDVQFYNDEWAYVHMTEADYNFLADHGFTTGNAAAKVTVNGKDSEFVKDGNYWYNIRLYDKEAKSYEIVWSIDGKVIAKATYSTGTGGEEVEKTYAIDFTKTTLVKEDGRVWLSVSGTYTGSWNESEFALDVQLVGGTWPTYGGWTNKVELNNGAFTIKYDISNADDGRYILHAIIGGKSTDGDFSAAQPSFGTVVTEGTVTYTLGINDLGWENRPYIITIDIKDTAAPEYKATDATLAIENGIVYFVISGTYAGYDEATLRSTLIDVYFDLQKRGDDWYKFTAFNRVAIVDTGTGTWTLKIDVTNQELHANPFTIHFGVDGSAGDLKLDTAHAQDGYSVKHNDKGLKYTIVNKHGSSAEADNYGVVSLKIENLYTVNDVVDLEANNGKMYVVITGTHEYDSVEALKAALKFDVQNPDSGWSYTDLPNFELTESNGSFTAKVDISDLAIGQYLVHVGNGIDVGNEDGIAAITAGGKSYSYENRDFGGWTRFVLTIKTDTTGGGEETERTPLDIFHKLGSDGKPDANANFTWNLGGTGAIDYAWEIVGYSDTVPALYWDCVYINIYDIAGLDAQGYDFLNATPFAQYVITARGFVNWSNIDAAIMDAWKASTDRKAEHTFVFAMQVKPNAAGVEAGYTDSLLNYATLDGARQTKVYTFGTTLPSDIQVKLDANNFIFLDPGTMGRGSVFTMGVKYVALKWNDGKQDYVAYMFDVDGKLHLYANTNKEGAPLTCDTVGNGWVAIGDFKSWVTTNYGISDFSTFGAWEFSTRVYTDGSLYPEDGAWSTTTTWCGELGDHKMSADGKCERCGYSETVEEEKDNAMSPIFDQEYAGKWQGSRNSDTYVVEIEADAIYVTINGGERTRAWITEYDTPGDNSDVYFTLGKDGGTTYNLYVSGSSLMLKTSGTITLSRVQEGGDEVDLSAYEGEWTGGSITSLRDYCEWTAVKIEGNNIYLYDGDSYALKWVAVIINTAQSNDTTVAFTFNYSSANYEGTIVFDSSTKLTLNLTCISKSSTASAEFTREGGEPEQPEGKVTAIHDPSFDQNGNIIGVYFNTENLSKEQMQALELVINGQSKTPYEVIDNTGVEGQYCLKFDGIHALVGTTGGTIQFKLNGEIIGLTVAGNGTIGTSTTNGYVYTLSIVDGQLTYTVEEEKVEILDGIYVNGEFKRALIQNPFASGENLKAEYWLGEDETIDLEVGQVITFYMSGVQCTGIWITGLGVTGINTNTNSVTVTEAGPFIIILKDYSNATKPIDWVAEFRIPTTAEEGDTVPEGCDPIKITIGSLETITIYLVDSNGNPVGEDRFSQFCIYTFEPEIFGIWANSTTQGKCKSEITVAGSTVPKGWIFRWGTNYGTQTANIEGAIEAGGCYLIELPAGNQGAAKVTKLTLKEEPQPTGEITEVYGPAFDPDIIVFYVKTVNLTEDDIKGVELVINGASKKPYSTGATDVGFVLRFDGIRALAGTTAGTYTLQLKLNGETKDIAIAGNGNIGATQTENGYNYTLSVQDGKLVMIVEAAHVHSYTGNKYSNLGNGKHAPKCDDESCGYVNESAAVDHDISYDKESTTHTEKCATCGYTGTAATHEFGYESLGAEEHKGTCRVCSYEMTDIHDNQGEADSCSKCGQPKAEEGPIVKSLNFATSGLSVDPEKTILDGKSVEIGDVTLAFATGTGSNDIVYYINGTNLRVYNGNTLTFTASEGLYIKQIEFTVSAGNYGGSFKASTGKYSDSEHIWTGSAQQVVLTGGGTQLRATDVTVTYSSVYEEPEEEVVPSGVFKYTLTPAGGTNNGYDGNCDITIEGIVWNLTGNSQMQPWRIGGKSLTAVDRTLYSKTKMEGKVEKIEITFGAASSITVNSMTLIVARDAGFSTDVSTKTLKFAANSTLTVTSDGEDWSNCYYKLILNVTVSGSSNRFVELKEMVFTGTEL